MTDLPAGREFDMLISQRVFGWQPGYRGAPPYSTDLVAAMHVMESIGPRWTSPIVRGDRPVQLQFALIYSPFNHTDGGYWEAGWYDYGYEGLEREVYFEKDGYGNGGEVRFVAEAETIPLAICRAALLTVEPR